MIQCSKHTNAVLLPKCIKHDFPIFFAVSHTNVHMSEGTFCHVEAQMENEAATWHTCLGHYPLQSYVFYFSQIRTLVAMVTLSFHRLIMGKVEIDNICQVIWDI